MVSISCHAENGDVVLKSLEASRGMESIKEIFGETIKNFGCGTITSDPWVDESTKEYRFNTVFEFHECFSYEITEVDAIVESIQMSGRIDLVDGYKIFELPIIE
jgi:hypothetical protein